MSETISASLTASTETITASLTVADETITAELNTAARGPEGPAGSGGGGDALVADPLSQFAATTSAQLAGVLTDETGTGSAVFATSPTLTSPVLNTGVSGTAILDEDDLASDSDTQLATQQSIKAYVDDAIKAVTITAKVNEAGGITKGQVVFISGATGGFPQVSLADNTDFSKSDVLAVATETKTNGQNVAITIAGLVENIDTSAYTEGVVLYLGTSGNITETHPTGINAVERIGHAVKINASTGSLLVELDGLTVINDHDGIMRHQIVNQNAGTSASAAYTMVNDADHRASISLASSLHSGFPDSMVVYSEGYGPLLVVQDGNQDIVWLTDTTDAHTSAATPKMTLTASGNLTVTGTIGGSNLSGTNTGDQDLSAYQLEPSEGGFVDGDKTKLDAIEASADVTDATNVTAAGALMDSEVTNLAQVKAFDSTDYATAAHASDTANPHAVTKAQVGLTSVDDTADADKPVSTATQTALDLKAPLASPSITGAATVSGTLDILHTATSVDDHALEIDCDAAGFGDVKAIDVAYDTGAITTGQDEAVILVNIDESSATGGDVTALEVLATEGSANINGMLLGVGVNPIEQLSGVFVDMDSALVNATDRLTEFTTAGSDVQMFVADNDTVTIGSSAKFEEIEFLLAIAASGSGIAPTFDFSTGSGTWTTFTPVDGTNGMRNTGVIAWIDGDIPTWAVGTGAEYLIRITRTRNSLSTPPTESKVQIAAATEYKWDKDGALSVNSVTATGNVTAANTGANAPVSTAQAAADAVVLAAAVQRANHTGTQTLATISDAGTAAAAATGDFTPIAHASDTANPHAVTKAQVGLGSVDNTSDANAPVSTAQAAADAVVLAAAIQRANHTGTQTLATISDAGTAAAAATGDFTPIAHATDTANPHSVTATQVGLGNVDNTSDANAPVSTAQASADAVVLAAAVQRANHTGTQTLATISDAGTAAANDTTDFPLTDPSGVTGADAVTNIISLTQAEYNAIGTPGASTLYILTD